MSSAELLETTFLDIENWSNFPKHIFQLHNSAIIPLNPQNKKKRGKRAKESGVQPTTIVKELAKAVCKVEALSPRKREDDVMSQQREFILFYL